MPTLTVTVKNKIATASDIKVICGNSDYTVNFVFDSEWDSAATKTMRVKFNGNYTDVVFTGTQANLPIINNTLGIEIGVFCGNLETTTPAVFDCIKSIRCGTSAPAAPSNTVYDQIIALLNTIVENNAGITSITFDRVDENGGNVYTVLLTNEEEYEITCPKGAKGDTGSAATVTRSNIVSALGNSSPNLSENDYSNSEKTKVANNESSIQDINAKIPNAATSLNQLADKNFVNSSIATNTAYFRGTYTNTSDLPLTGNTPNDYAFVVIYDTTEPTVVKQYDRYKWNNTQWVFEYTLNNSSYTQDQWDAINSGITSSIVSDIDNKVDKVTGKQLSTEDYTTAEKSKVAEIDNKLEATDYATDNVGGVIKWWTGTQAQYEAISTKDSNTLYMIVEG